jgi:hypothetical protein
VFLAAQLWVSFRLGLTKQRHVPLVRSRDLENDALTLHISQAPSARQVKPNKAPPAREDPTRLVLCTRGVAGFSSAPIEVD